MAGTKRLTKKRKTELYQEFYHNLREAIAASDRRTFKEIVSQGLRDVTKTPKEKAVLKIAAELEGIS